MRKLFLSSILAILFCTGFIYSQNIIHVSTALDGITTAIATANPGDIFVLDRDSVYLYEGRIDVNVPITIRAEGTGVRPKLRQIPNSSGTFAGDPDIQVAANFTIQGIDMDGYRTSLTSFTGRAIRLAADNLRIVIDSCVFADYWLRTIDLNDQSGITIIYKNNLNLWDGRRDRIDNGRTIDTRGAGVDTVVFQNNTVLNCNDRIFRNIGTPGLIKYALFDHNTFYGNIGYRPPFQFRATKQLIFTNNVVVNVGLLGTDTVSNRADEIAYTNPYRTICKLTITGTDTLGSTIDMKDNVIYNDSKFNDLFTLNPDTIQVMPLWNQEFRKLVTDSAAAVSTEHLTFVRPPSLDSLVDQIKNYIMGGTNWSNSGFLAKVEVLKPEEVNMSYGTSAAAYKGGENGYPIGDLNWYPDLKAKWENNEVLAVNDNYKAMPSKFSLEQNYPNPFNPTTTFSYSLPKLSEVNVVVYNIVGQVVARIVNHKMQNAGRYEVNWNGTDDFGKSVASGVYFYQLKTNEVTLTKKMMLLK